MLARHEQDVSVCHLQGHRDGHGSVGAGMEWRWDGDGCGDSCGDWCRTAVGKYDDGSVAPHMVYSKVASHDVRLHGGYMV